MSSLRFLAVRYRLTVRLFPSLRLLLIVSLYVGIAANASFPAMAGNDQSSILGPTARWIMMQTSYSKAKHRWNRAISTLCYSVDHLTQIIEPSSLPLLCGVAIKYDQRLARNWTTQA
jgi:hypothetical protein